MPPCSPKGIIDEAEPGFFREWLQDLACNHLINSIHSQHAASGPAGRVKQRTEAEKIRAEIALRHPERDPPAVKTIERHLSQMSKAKSG